MPGKRGIVLSGAGLEEEARQRALELATPFFPPDPGDGIWRVRHRHDVVVALCTAQDQQRMKRPTNISPNTALGAG
jgi:hypothetical protein